MWEWRVEERDVKGIDITSNRTSNFVPPDQADFAIRRDHSEESTYFVKERKKGVVQVIRSLGDDLTRIASQTVGARSVSEEELVEVIDAH